MEELSKHQRKQLAKEQREREKIEREKATYLSRKKTKRVRTIVILTVILIVAFMGYQGIVNREPLFTTQPVHWHASIDISLCGHPYTDLLSKGGKDYHFGSALLHTHGDGIIHVEGQPLHAEDVRLGKFMDTIGYEFSSTTLIDKKEGDLCNGKPGKVSMFVNDAENTEFRDYIIKPTSDANQQRIRLEFS